MPPHRRPTAFEVTYGIEPSPVAQTSARPSHALSAAPKRKSEHSADSNSHSKRHKHTPRLPSPVFFNLPDAANYVVESADMLILNEDDSDREEGSSKPIRNLSTFHIFDPTRRNECLSLSLLEKADGVTRVFEAYGQVSAVLENDEDEGQEAHALGGNAVQWVRTGAIIRLALDYTKNLDPVYIETEHSWYILQVPHSNYRPFLLEFYLPHRITQLLISTALSNPGLTKEMFKERWKTSVAPLGGRFSEEDVTAARPIIRDVVGEVARTRPGVKNVGAVKEFVMRPATAVSSRARIRGNKPSKRSNGRKVNVDLAVLKVENQSPTYVTSGIGRLAQPYFREDLRVVAPAPPPDSGKQLEEKAAARTALDDLKSVIDRCHKRPQPKWNYEREDRLGRYSRYVSAISIDGVHYELGDTVIVLIGGDPQAPKRKGSDNGPSERALPRANEIQSDQSFQDFFWFARIIHINVDLENMHVQWYNHGIDTVMKDLAHPRELFLQNLCGPINLIAVAGKVTVHHVTPNESVENIRVPAGEYFCRLEYEPLTAAFSSTTTTLDKNRKPPHNCPVCALIERQDQDNVPLPLPNQSGVRYRGQDYHRFDFVLYQSSEPGPGHIGQIIDFGFPERDTLRNPIVIVVRKLGRISSLSVLPENELRDERHLFLTENKRCNYHNIEAEKLIRPCHVRAAPERLSDDVQAWVTQSPNHFYVRFVFASLDVERWGSKRLIKRTELSQCLGCYTRHRQELADLDEFITSQKSRPIRALDLFGGSGIQSSGVAIGSSGIITVPAAIEIGPSAAKTYRENSPQTTVYNVCASEALQYIVKKDKGAVATPPVDKETGEPVHVSLRPGDIDMVVAGFPCQSHSALNMYKAADDVKSSLILVLLSYIEFLRPYLLFLENVPGFLWYRLMSVQRGRHRVDGGIEQGGLKLLVRALIDLGYQVRFSVLQAGQYGTPQGRVRFFLIASLPGYPLPKFPQPTHDFPMSNNVLPHLRISLSNGRIIEPIQTARGAALHPEVTIGDAVSDLRRFDWKHPRPENMTDEERRKAVQRKKVIPAIPCYIHLPHWGLEGVSYEHEPRSRFQLQARARPATDLQHFTRQLPSKTVERVVNVDLRFGSDYRSLPGSLGEFQFANPVSSVAKSIRNWCMYGRLAPTDHFPTTVTNVAPTAKQSRVINPWCRRMLTVRELARSQGFPDDFLFHSIDDDVITHRIIGNAVPLPLSIAVGREIRQSLYERWKQDRMVIDLT